MISDWKLLTFLLAATLIPSSLFSWLIVGWVRKNAHRLGLMDEPNERKVHTKPIPRGGGLGISTGVCLTYLLGIVAVWLASHGQVVPASLVPESVQIHLDGLWSSLPGFLVILVGGILLSALGFADDLLSLPWQVRLVSEFAVASFVVYWQNLQMTAYIDAPWLTSIISVFWIVLLINSFNMLDNMDGLSAGVAVILCTVLALVLATSGDATKGQPQLFVASMLLCLIGALLGFLKYNWPPATIFMGDSGSYFIGYWVAVTTLLSTYVDVRGDAPHAVVAPLCLLAIPIYDTLSVVWIRISEGRSPFQADRRHFSHRLVDMGLSKKQAVWTIYLATLTCSLGALILPRTDIVGAFFVLAIVASMLTMVTMMERLPTLAPRNVANRNNVRVITASNSPTQDNAASVTQTAPATEPAPDHAEHDTKNKEGAGDS